MRSDPHRHNQDKCCCFHCDQGHDTLECRQLRDEIESLIKRGYLGCYVRRNEDRPIRREHTPVQPINNKPNGQEINVIVGGFDAGRESSQSRCDYARRMHQVERPPIPRPTPYPSLAHARSEEAITFSDIDLRGARQPTGVTTVLHSLLARKWPVADPEVLPTPTREPSTSQGTPAKDLLPVRVDDDTEHVLYIGALLPEAEQQRYKAFLFANLDVFAWSDDELHDIPPKESLGLFEAGKNAGESEDDYLERLARVSRRELAGEPGSQADLDLRRFLVLFLGRLLFATRGNAVHCHFLPLLADLGEVWAYLHLPALGRGELTWPGLAPLACRWESRRDTRHLANQLERLQEAIDNYPYLDVVWQPYLGEGDEGQPWLAQARPYFGRSSVVEFPVWDRFRRPGRSFRGLHDTTDWRERAREQIENWERKGKSVKSTATTYDAYLRAYALKYGGKVDVAGEVASLRALLLSATHDREAARRETEELRRELEIVRRGAGGASSSRGGESDRASLQAQLTAAISRAEEAERHLEDRAQRDQYQRELQTTRGDRDQLCI
ncbi:hypothetical protein Taro_020321 [Colocasia esculenta]|uniref:Uncharacterized protein n=1 Tax=Colocasia esculenta TaxID=4460 RepID=A0A843V208_COLES|nr:hypothetical protein [Colocasia esculenta]